MRFSPPLARVARTTVVGLLVTTATSPVAAQEGATDEAPRARRVVVATAFSHAVTAGPSVSRDGLGVGVRVFPWWRIGLGASAMVYGTSGGGYDAAPSAWPLTETAWAASTEATFTVLHRGGADLYVLGGLGAISTRPLSVVDPTRRRFDFEPRVAMTAGVGGSLHLAGPLSVTLELRDVMYVEQLERRDTSRRNGSPDAREGWFGEKPIVNRAEVHVALTMLLLPWASAGAEAAR